MLSKLLKIEGIASMSKSAQFPNYQKYQSRIPRIAEESVIQDFGLVRIAEESVIQAFGLVRIAEESVMQALGLVRIAEE